jgi:hypothetical protein
MSAPAVIYAAKSTEDVHGSIETQLADPRAICEREGWTIVGEYRDEGFSAYRGNRGPGLEQAKRHVTRAAGEHDTTAMLVAQHSDRLRAARATSPVPPTTSASSTSRCAAKTCGCVPCRTTRTLRTRFRAVLIGERNMEDSKRKPVGAVPEGYRAEATIGPDGWPVSSRVIDSARREIVERIMGMIEAGHTFGDAARALNADGLRTRRGKPWTTRAVRHIALNPDYTGSTGYPPLISVDRHAAILSGVRRMERWRCRRATAAAGPPRRIW